MKDIFDDKGNLSSSKNLENGVLQHLIIWTANKPFFQFCPRQNLQPWKYLFRRFSLKIGIRIRTLVLDLFLFRQGIARKLMKNNLNIFDSIFLLLKLDWKTNPQIPNFRIK